jgi:peptide/nickel transport system substrate-binding protein
MFKRLVTASLAVALLASACTSDDTDTDTDTDTAPEVNGQPVEGGTIVVASPGQLPAQGTLNPAVNTQGGMQRVAAPLFSGLVEIDESAQTVPALATEWEIQDDGQVYVFTLRDDVMFHDGEPLTAEDVKWTYEAALLRNHARTQSSIGPALAEPCTRAPEEPNCPSIEAKEASGDGPATVTFRFAQPYAPLLQQLTHTDGAILPKHIWEGQPPPTAAQPWPQGQDPVGTGAFRFVSHDASEVIYERNTDYFKEDLPHLERMVQRSVPTPTAQVQALLAGEVDWLWNVRGQDIATLEAAPDIVIVVGSQSAGGATNCIQKLAFNLWERGADPAAVRAGDVSPHPILGDVRVRQAMAHALELDVYVDQVLQNDGSQVATSPVSSEIEWAHTDAPIPAFDRDAARRLLDEAGWVSPGEGQTRMRDGQPLVIDMSSFDTDLPTKIAQDLAAVGIEVQVTQVDPAGMTALYGGREFDTLVVSNCQLTDPEIGVRRYYHSTAITGAPFTNGAGYNSPEVDRLFDQASSVLDRSQRADFYVQAQEQIAEDLPYLWLLETVSVRAHTDACEDLRAFTGHFAEMASCER